MKETDLYPPIKAFLEGQGYEVKGEVQDCDVLAVRDEQEPVVVELKNTLNIDVLLQAVDRKALTQKVYVGVRAPCKALERRRKSVFKLLRMLGVGLLTVRLRHGSGTVAVLLDPAPYRPQPSKHRQERLLGEFARRVGDPNLGGSARRQGIVTAYRQRALTLAAHLDTVGPSKASEVARAVGEPKARDILYRDVYGWFDRVGRGVYAISPRGQEEIPGWLNADAGKAQQDDGS